MIQKNAREIINERAVLHPNDPVVYEYWDRLTKILSIDLKETIKFLRSCNEEEILWISEVFEDVAYNLQSQEYINCLEELDEKYPHLNLTSDIKIAKDFMK
ncbi:hypothetical protein R9X47_24400 [Wukongibacter baidiensis]|uniref:hypothetical protein n=1 Tax=Wukongibacter baidiensis TaxID=1723361 RepID=UPI003D7F3F40